MFSKFSWKKGTFTILSVKADKTEKRVRIDRYALVIKTHIGSIPNLIHLVWDIQNITLIASYMETSSHLFTHTLDCCRAGQAVQNNTCSRTSQSAAWLRNGQSSLMSIRAYFLLYYFDKIVWYVSNMYILMCEIPTGWNNVVRLPIWTPSSRLLIKIGPA